LISSPCKKAGGLRMWLVADSWRRFDEEILRAGKQEEGGEGMEGKKEEEEAGSEQLQPGRISLLIPLPPRPHRAQSESTHPSREQLLPKNLIFILRSKHKRWVLTVL
jgi:hypothetical protein